MNESEMQHGLDWTPEIDPAGWLASEKFNGCRAYWDGKTLWSRGGLRIDLPESWQAALPRGRSLDGELYAGPTGLARCVGAVRWSRFTPDMTFRVFDMPESTLQWADRIIAAWTSANQIIRPVSWARIESIDHLRRHFRAIQARDGEGLMLRHPDIPATPGRTSLLLKVKYDFQFNEETSA